MGLLWLSLLLLQISPFAIGKDAEIIDSNEYPGGTYKENRLAFMTVIYTKPEGFRTDWRYVKFTLGYDRPILSLPELIETKNISRVESADGRINETLKIRTNMYLSGNYTFRIVDPTTNQTVQTADFILNVAAAPSELKVQKVGGGQSKNLQLGQIYNYDCVAKGYPHPTISWQFSPCIAELPECEDDWKPIGSANEIRQFDSTYHRRQQIGLKAAQIGTLRCVANNTEGSAISEGEEIIPSDIRDTEILSGFAIHPQIAEAYRGDQFNLTCQMQKTEFQQFLSWTKKQPNGNELVLAQLAGVDGVLQRKNLDKRHQLSFDSQSSNFSNKYILTFNNISKSDAGYYVCKTRDQYQRDYIRPANITVVDDFAPLIDANNTGDVQIQFDPETPINLQCEATGGPQPTVVWYKGGKIFDASRNNNITIKPDSLHFAHTYQSDEGEYVCEATNRVGTARRTFQLSQKPPETFFQQNKIPIIMGIVIGLIVLICLAAVLRMTLISRQRGYKLLSLEMELKANEQNQFDPTLPIFDIIEKGPTIKPGYPYCLKVDSIIFDRQNVVKLGEGNFGVVLQQKLQKPDGTVEQVALKRPKSNFEVAQYRMLYKEICLMTYLGKHPNIVNMIGCVTNIAHGQLYMVMELCSEGSLERLLKSVRTDFGSKFCSELHSPYQNVPDANRYYREDFPKWPSIKATMNGCIFHSDLISYAYQIASAMEYLAKLNFVHRDLAARNILLSHNLKVAKIADFGLAHQIGLENYKVVDKQTTLILPTRWSAPESLIFKEFSSGSDVWSFGNVIGEIFTLGEIPFAHVTDGQFDPNKLLNGAIRPNRPQLATDNIYQLMLDCCTPERRNRPTFSEAKLRLSEEFQRCSPEQLADLQVLLDEIQLQIDNQTNEVQSVENSIYYTYEPHQSVPNQYYTRHNFLSNIPIVKYIFSDEKYAGWPPATVNFTTTQARNGQDETVTSADRITIRTSSTSSSRTTPIPTTV